MAPYEGFMTQDGFLFIAALNDNLYRRLCACLELPHLATHPDYLTNADRVAHRDALSEEIGARMLLRSAGEWEKLLRDAGLPCSRVNTVDQVLDDPQVRALGLMRPWHHPTIPDFTLIDHPISYNGTRSFQQLPPPGLGEHSTSILTEVGFDADGIEAVSGPRRAAPEREDHTA
jgi:crotonobetainyl-CoA:carnitine CoA-transferase CaiB-like acyl-CoA transferase